MKYRVIMEVDDQEIENLDISLVATEKDLEKIWKNDILGDSGLDITIEKIKVELL